MARYGMVIDLQRCVGCGGCALACKVGNNTAARGEGQTFNWADFIYETKGSWPDVSYAAIPVLCNHCSKAACVEACPVTPKAMYKTADGITMHNSDRCIGCQRCQEACPYSALDVDEEGKPYSVISYNADAATQYAAYKDPRALIAGGTASGAEIARLTQQMPPSRTLYRHPDYGSTRREETVEKCTFCSHLLLDGHQPYCVEACPAKARLFGDLDDAESAPSAALAVHRDTAFRVQEEAGTEPNVHYIRRFTTERQRQDAGDSFEWDD